MFKFITLAFICIIAFASVTEATKLHQSNSASLKAETKAVAKAIQALNNRIEMMEENGEDVDFDLGNWAKNAWGKVQKFFH